MVWIVFFIVELKLKMSMDKILFVYMFFVVGSLFCVLVRMILVVIGGFLIVEKFFLRMFCSIFRVFMLFFDLILIGRILNRVSVLN